MAAGALPRAAGPRWPAHGLAVALLAAVLLAWAGLVALVVRAADLPPEAAGTMVAVFPPGFDITAERERHFGFGAGPHHCLGHAIARSDMAVAFSILPSRMRNLRPGGPATYLPDSGNTGPISLPVLFDAAA